MIALNTFALQILEIYQNFDGPKLYSASGPVGDLWLVVWIDSSDEEDVWLYIPVSKSRLNLIRGGALSLNTAFADAEGGQAYRVVVDNKDGTNTNSVINTNTISPEFLPKAGIKLNLEAAEVPFPLIENPIVVSKRTRQEVFDLEFFVSTTMKHQMPVDSLARILASFQNTMRAMASARRQFNNAGDHWSGNVVQNVSYQFSAAFSGSVGIRLVSPPNDSLFNDSELCESTEAFFELLKCKGNEAQLRAMFTTYKARSATRYKRFLKELSGNGISLEVTWASLHKGRGGKLRLETGEATEAIRIIELYEESAPEEYPLFVRLLGGNIKTNHFAVADEGENIKYAGKAVPGVMEGKKFGENYIASIKETVRTGPDGEEQTKYELMALTEPGSESPQLSH